MHLLGRLEVELVAAVAHAVLVGEVALRLDAEQRVVRVGVLVAQVVDVVGGHRAQAGLLGEPRELRQQLALLGQAGVLQLDEDVLGAEELRQTADLGQRRLVVAVAQQQRGDAPLMQPVRAMRPSWCSLEQLPVGARLVVVALEVGARGELDEVLVAGLVARQQREVREALLDAGRALRRSVAT